MPTRRREFVRPPTAQEAVLAELRRAIVRGDLQPGATLLQEEIGDSLGMSRVPVREALHILEGEGLLTRAPKKAYQVTSLDEAELNDLFRLRELLEGLSTRRCWSSPTHDMVTGLASVLAELEQAAAGDAATFANASREFHFAVFGGGPNSRLRKLITQMWSTADPYCIRFFDTPAERTRVTRDAKRIARSLRLGDLELPIKLVGEHRRRLAAYALRTRAHMAAQQLAAGDAR